MYHTDDTIAAIASAPGGAARGIVRLSGPDIISILAACFRPSSGQDLREPRSAIVLSGMVSLDSSPITDLPADLYLWPDQRSYTRQPVAEIHTIGSPPLLSALLRTVCAAGARLAEPGEFTLRAFLAGRLDLIQAEAVLGVIDARGQHELQTALGQLAGGLTRPLSELRESLLELLAHLEAGLDFVEDDIQFITSAQIQQQLDQAAEMVGQLTAKIAARGRLDELPRAALVGWPNVGKSSLFNALSPSGVALVSNQPGTTRDYLVCELDLDGIGCQLIDTAGAELITEAEAISGLAQQLTAAQAEACDIRVLCLEAGRSLNEWESAQLNANHVSEQLVVITKCDGPIHLELAADVCETSCTTGKGLGRLRQTLRGAVLRVHQSELATNLTSYRCAESLRTAGMALALASQLNQQQTGEELIAAELRAALNELGRVVGVIYTDDILDRIFSRFCIGK